MLTIAALPAQGTWFDLTGSNTVLEQTGRVAVDRITALLTANTGSINSNSSTFGINGPGGDDDADEIDVGEILTIAFDQPVWFEAMAVNQFGSGTQGTIGIGSLAYTISTTGTHDLPDVLVPFPGGRVLVQAGSGQFSVPGFAVRMVPEPAGLALVLVAPLVLGRRAPGRAPTDGD